MANIKKTRTDMCLMDYYPSEKFRDEYGDEAADNYIVWNFRERLGDDVEILSISVLYIVSWETIEEAQVKIPKKIMYLCTYVEA